MGGAEAKAQGCVPLGLAPPPGLGTGRPAPCLVASTWGILGEFLELAHVLLNFAPRCSARGVSLLWVARLTPPLQVCGVEAPGVGGRERGALQRPAHAGKLPPPPLHPCLTAYLEVLELWVVRHGLMDPLGGAVRQVLAQVKRRTGTETIETSMSYESGAAQASETG